MLIVVILSSVVYLVLSYMDKAEDYFRNSTCSLIIFLFLLGVFSLVWRLVCLITS